MDAIRDFYDTYASVINCIGLNAILGLSLYLTLACGLLSLANAAFMGIGAYTAAPSACRASRARRSGGRSTACWRCCSTAAGGCAARAWATPWQRSARMRRPPGRW